MSISCHTLYEVYGVEDIAELSIPDGYLGTDDFRPGLSGEVVLGGNEKINGKGHCTGGAITVLSYYGDDVSSRLILEKL